MIKSSDPKHSDDCEARPRTTVKRLVENPALAQTLSGVPKLTLKSLTSDLTIKGAAGRLSISTAFRARTKYDECAHEDSLLRCSALPDYLKRISEANPGTITAICLAEHGLRVLEVATRSLVGTLTVETITLPGARHEDGIVLSPPTDGLASLASVLPASDEDPPPPEEAAPEEEESEEDQQLKADLLATMQGYSLASLECSVEKRLAAAWLDLMKSLRDPAAVTKEDVHSCVAFRDSILVAHRQRIAQFAIDGSESHPH